MNHIKVLLKSTEKSEFFLFQDDDCVTAMSSIPPASLRLLVKSWADFTLQIVLPVKGIDAWKGYPANQYQGYNHVLNIPLSVYRSLMTTTFSDDKDEVPWPEGKQATGIAGHGQS